jgi:predicted Zn-dependent protease
MLNVNVSFLRLAIATKAIFIAQLFIFQIAYADNTPPAIHLEMPNTAWWNKVANSQNPNDIHFNAAVNLSGLKMLAQVRERMIKVALQPVQIAIQKSDTVNAFARKESGFNLIIFTTGFIKQFGNDADVLANTLGHEMAHHIHGHLHGGSGTIGLMKHETSNLTQTKMQSAKESQNNELAADATGIEYAVQAGYSACGGYRLFTYLQNNPIRKNEVSYLSHPRLSERIDLVNKINLQIQKSQCS